MDYNSLAKASSLSKLNFLLKDSAVYGLASAISRFVSIFTVPVLTRTFSKEEFGAIDAISIFGALIIPFLFMGMDSAIARYFFEEKEYQERKQIISQPLFLCLAISLVFSFILIFFSQEISQVYLQTTDYDLEFKIMAATLPLSFLTAFSMSLLKWTFERKKFLIVSIGSSMLTVVLVLAFVVGLNLGATSVFYAALVAKLLFSVIGIFYIRKWLLFTLDFDRILKLLRFGLPLMFVSFLVALIPSLDRYIISTKLSLTDLGLYALGMKVVTILLIVDRGIQTAWGPFAFAMYKDANSEKTFNLILKFFAISLSIIVLLLVSFEKLLILLFGSSGYDDAHNVVVILGFALVARSLTAVSGIGIELSKRTEFHIISYLLGALIGFWLMYTLAVPFGIFGVAVGFLVSRLLVFILEGFFSNRLYQTRMNCFAPTIIMIIALVFGIGIDSLYTYHWYFQASIGLITTAVFGLLIWFIYLTKSHRLLLINKIRTLF